jgi:hypothetical protein
MASMLKFIVTALIAISLLQPGQSPDETIPHDIRIEGNVSTIADDILVEGVVAGDVISWTGNIIIRGYVHGDVVSYTGNVTISQGARVDGSVLALTGELAVETAALGGSAITGGNGGRLLSRIVGVFAPLPQAPSGAANAGNWLFSLFLSIATITSALLLIGTWPNRLSLASHTLIRKPIQALSLGVLAGIALAAITLILAGVLAASVIGLPLSVLLVVVLHVPYLFGVAALIQAARTTLDPTAHGLSFKTGLTALALVVPLLLIGLVAPLVALVLFYAVASPGLGAAILTRGGMLHST